MQRLESADPHSRGFWLWRLLAGVILPMLASNAIRKVLPLQTGTLVAEVAQRVVQGVVSFGILVLLLRLLERRSLSQSGLFAREHWRQRFGLGILLAAALVLVQAGLLLAAGYYAFAWDGSAGAPTAFGLSTVLLVVAVDEEIRYRALALRPIDDGLGSFAALAISAVVFGLSHLGNRGATVAGVMVITAGGVFFGAAYLRFRSLWVPIGMHWAWNTLMGVVLGLPVSGVPLPSLLRAHVHGAEAITGGDFGPEGSAVMAGLVLVITVISVAWVVRSGAFRTRPALRRLGAGSGSGPPHSNR